MVQKRIGESRETSLLVDISRQLDRLIKIMGIVMNNTAITTTTTTTTTP